MAVTGTLTEPNPETLVYGNIPVGHEEEFSFPGTIELNGTERTITAEGLFNLFDRLLARGMYAPMDRLPRVGHGLLTAYSTPSSKVYSLEYPFARRDLDGAVYDREAFSIIKPNEGSPILYPLAQWHPFNQSVSAHNEGSPRPMEQRHFIIALHLAAVSDPIGYLRSSAA